MKEPRVPQNVPQSSSYFLRLVRHKEFVWSSNKRAQKWKEWLGRIYDYGFAPREFALHRGLAEWGWKQNISGFNSHWLEPEKNVSLTVHVFQSDLMNPSACWRSVKFRSKLNLNDEFHFALIFIGTEQIKWTARSTRHWLPLYSW